MRANRRERGRARVSGWLLLSVCLAAPWLAVAGALVVNASPKPQVESSAKPVLVSASQASTQESIAADLKVDWVDGDDVISPSWQGIVTAISSDILGQNVENGKRTLQVDGVWRIAAVTEKPFYRPLGEGDSGDDVQMLNEYLNALGYSAGGSNTWSRWTADGMKALGKDIGVKDANVMDPSWFVWIPRDDFVPAVINAEVGAPAPAQTDPLMKTAPVPIRASVQLKDTSSALAQDVAWNIDVNGLQIPFTGDAANAVADAPSALRSLPRQEAPFSATIRRASVTEGVQVPASSLLSGESGYCILTSDADGLNPSSWRKARVTVLGGELGMSIIAPAEQLGPFVVANPFEISGATRDC